MKFGIGFNSRYAVAEVSFKFR